MPSPALPSSVGCLCSWDPWKGCSRALLSLTGLNRPGIRGLLCASWIRLQGLCHSAFSKHWGTAEEGQRGGFGLGSLNNLLPSEKAVGWCGRGFVQQALE